jgi:hypothetical protein
MNSQFNQGYSSGRTLQKIFTLPAQLMQMIIAAWYDYEQHRYRTTLC